MINWKVVVGSGATAAVLSLLTGIISGVSFGTLLLRALMWSVIFCGVGTAVSFLISKYLPELLSLSPPEEKTEARPNVDIVLPDENPHTDHHDDDGTTSQGALAEQYRTDGEEESYEGESEIPATGGNNLVEEVEELGPPGSGSRERAAGPSRDDVEEAEELPDLEGEADDFSATEEGGSSRLDGISDISSLSGQSNTVDVLGLQTDTEEIAQAIRTALKKDQKG